MYRRAAASGLFATLIPTGASMAAPATSTASLNVRSGPGTSYGVVDVLRDGERVDVRDCRSNGWCFVEHSGPDGWVSSNYLSSSGTLPRRQNDVDVDVSVDLPNFSFSFGRGNGFSFGVPPRGSRRDLVCLVTFERRSQVAAGRDADVVRANVMTRAEAERRDRPNDRQAIYDYGTNRQTRDTCNYLDRLN